MAKRHHDHHTVLVLVGIVGLVFVTGLLLLSRGGLTANVVYEPAVSCGACTGEPVCAAKGQRVFTYESTCDALCGSARVVFESPCEAIPRAGA